MGYFGVLLKYKWKYSNYWL